MKRLSRRFPTSFLRLFRHIMNIFFPRTCAGCRGDIPAEAESVVCVDCWDALPRWNGLSCIVCGLPLPDGGARCRDCRRARRAFRFLRSAGVYEGSLGRMIRTFKYEGREDLAEPFARLLAELWEGEPRLAPVDAVVPVPLHWIRERLRGYNQAAVLARAFGRETGLPVLESALKRRKATKSQTELRRGERQENVKDAFDARRSEELRGKTILLVDDVCTTGATLEACARALKKGGARRVGALTVARQVPF